MPSRRPMPRLGLVCITASDAIRYRTITRTRLRTLTAAERRRALSELYEANLAGLRHALHFCRDRGISLYRISASLFPFADTAAGARVLQHLKRELGDAGRFASTHGIRLVNHPDQFVVLNSDSPAVVRNSRIILSAQAAVFDLLEQPRTPWATLEIHGGKGARHERLVHAITTLPDAVRTRLALENDEYAYGAEEIFQICRAANVPMVFDAHHHVVHEGLRTYEHPSIAAWTTKASTTWPDPAWQMVHISNGRAAFADPMHSDYIRSMPTAYRRVPYIEVEAKQKERAIDRLTKRWLRAMLPSRAHRPSVSRANAAGGKPKSRRKSFHR